MPLEIVSINPYRAFAQQDWLEGVAHSDEPATVDAWPLAGRRKASYDQPETR